MKWHNVTLTTAKLAVIYSPDWRINDRNNLEAVHIEQLKTISTKV